MIGKPNNLIRIKELHASHFMIYFLVWTIYIIILPWNFLYMNASALLLSIPLSSVGAWYFGFSGCLITTILTIPLHYFVLKHIAPHPAEWQLAFNPIGISTQLFISASIAVLKKTKEKHNELNSRLSQRVNQRTNELEELQHYIIQKQENAQNQLSRMLLCDIGHALEEMRHENNLLLNHLIFEDYPISAQVAKLKEMIDTSIDVVKNLDYVDQFALSESTEFEDAVRDVAAHFTKVSGVEFTFDLDPQPLDIPKSEQIQLYRITREAINNAVRHAKGSLIRITLKTDKDGTDLTIINDGLPLPQTIKGGLGLKLMHYRARQLGGELKILSLLNRETCVNCTIPRTKE